MHSSTRSFYNNGPESFFAITALARQGFFLICWSLVKSNMKPRLLVKH